MQGKFIIKALTAAVISCTSLVSQASISGNSHDGIVAVVNDEIILKSELNQATELVAAEIQKNGGNVTQDQAQTLALDELINEKLQLAIINRAGVVPNDAVINQQLLQIAQSQGVNSLSEFQSKLDAERAGSYAALRANLIQDAAIQALWQNQIQSRVRITDDQIDAFLKSPESARLNQVQYRLLHIRVPYLDNTANEQNRQQAALVAERVKSSLDAGMNLDQAMQNARGNYTPELQGADTGLINVFALPPAIAAEVDKLDIGQTSAPIATSGGIDIVKVVNKQQQNQVIVPEWQASHILARIDDNQSSGIAEQKINAIYQQLQQGADFETLAATYSDDAGSASQRGSLGWVNEGDMVPEFEAVMKNTAQGDFSTPFRSQFGWHILKVNDVRQRDVTELYRRNAAREYLFSRRAPQAQEDWLQELRSSAYIKIYE
ncbi:peptidylprolyl isomerase [Moraxella catarrhalis]|uniref:Chaperone SurA n=1 Tax=Moraxella catarrhalis TaxID=480 RepID=A0A198UGX3_MORCA|nr:peptidylprolyl isomerase [Moraxella catarrhalis]OAU94467.1 Survival protein SurA precursor Peptidyl-prolyl cis-trans isomerase SurA [Moraxella catarrhalis]OAU94915.1 Survival protein SurA precursor Peptidyl-prolyl cis-trans isomerase SurA [Moraxella catarrhalis]OAU95446.1 Survival protein SurA precursor Peptidyl-prolyl cis-trans isomerase SurA [Moraxella catarrhalis]